MPLCTVAPESHIKVHGASTGRRMDGLSLGRWPGEVDCSCRGDHGVRAGTELLLDCLALGLLLLDNRGVQSLLVVARAGADC